MAHRRAAPLVGARALALGDAARVDRPQSVARRALEHGRFYASLAVEVAVECWRDARKMKPPVWP